MRSDIVCRADRLFALADEIEARLAQGAASRLVGITPSLLARAFKGEF